MNLQYLLDRRTAVVTRFETLESVPNSGYHEDDEQARAMAKKKLAKQSERPVAMQHNTDVYIVGPDVAVVKAALTKWLEAVKARQATGAAEAEKAGLASEDAGMGDVSAQEKHAIKMAQMVSTSTDETLELKTDQFNGILYGLNEIGVPVVLTGVIA